MLGASTSRPAPRTVLPLVALCAASSMAGCAPVHRMDVSGLPVRTLAELEGDPSPLAAVMQGDEEGAAVVKLAAGDRLPLDLSVETPVVRVEAGDNVLVFDRDAYLYVSKTRALLSPDGERWAPVGDGKALRRLFGATRGTFQIGFGLSRERGPFARVALEARPH